ncbi:hypothetical protein [Mycolicibacterium confluentis]|uniref:Putative lipoprotein LppK n=1 Tax=Mycolicibacterium confluentis TaxID=28047 RepID=A0A7I7XVH8_9MYCO|nr:hypothetical protein [Mycolicibacterium confluentis]MCV7317873.1 hypothetical protein [Mycolicibacterium confluentis]ORV22897.1 hypothetical protein AWB99_25445 [Mycolicibacterium confluentis]BBZ33269.1 putative lipoprotein LppK [Mycolicibacterium confluentis]
MNRHLTTALSAATIFVAAFGLSGCGSEAREPAPPPAPTSSTVAPTVPSAPLPDPAALTDVVMKLTDPAVPGKDKLPLIEGATPADATTLDNFAQALTDNHMLPMTFTATELAWSGSAPGTVQATVTLTTSKPNTAPFSYPMEFKQIPTGWQLSRTTADLLLALGDGPR